MSAKTDKTKAYVLQAGEGISSHDASVKASKISTGGLLTLIESETTGGAPLHVHEHEDECFYVVSGTITVHCADDNFEVGAGGFAYLPRGIPHSWDVVGEKATVLMITVPGMLEEFLGEYHSAQGSERHAVAARYGITFLPEQG